MIEDVGADSQAVRKGGARVDLYGYTSMAVAAIQEQAKQIVARGRVALHRGAVGRFNASSATSARPLEAD